MNLRATPRLGDIFQVTLPDGSARFFQYVANDVTQLNSEVIRVFKQADVPEGSDSFAKIAAGKIDFHVHTSIKAGVKLKCWTKIGSAPVIEDKTIRFRTSQDNGNPSIKFSEKWYVWIINQKQVFVGPLNDELRSIDIGPVFPPFAIVEKMRTGEYGFFYPAG